MANHFPCLSTPSACTNEASPITNLSSEDPDFDVFFGRYYGQGENPPLGSEWSAYGCVGRCESTVSQEEANLCAANQAVLCRSEEWPETVPNPSVNIPGQPPFITTQRRVYYNEEQSANFICPDGSLYTYTVVAGRFSAFSQAAADSKALSYATNMVTVTRICIGSLDNSTVCLGGDYEESVSFTLMNPPAVVFVVLGSLPPGITLTYDDTSFTLSGAAAGTGLHTFTVRVEDVDGNYNQKEFSIGVATIANTTLSDADQGIAYSETLFHTGPVSGSVRWTVVDGSLPAGLSLNLTTGVISGTPTTSGSSTFTVQMEDGF